MFLFLFLFSLECFLILFSSSTFCSRALENVIVRYLIKVFEFFVVIVWGSRVIVWIVNEGCINRYIWSMLKRIVWMDLSRVDSIVVSMDVVNTFMCFCKIFLFVSFFSVYINFKMILLLCCSDCFVSNVVIVVKMVLYGISIIGMFVMRFFSIVAVESCMFCELMMSKCESVNNNLFVVNGVMFWGFVNNVYFKSLYVVFVTFIAYFKFCILIISFVFVDDDKLFVFVLLFCLFVFLFCFMCVSVVLK